jgi:hypothetical protein
MKYKNLPVIWDIWKGYTFLVRAATSSKWRHLTDDPSFSTKGFRLGNLPPDLVDSFVKALESSDKIPTRHTDFLPGYVFNPNMSKIEQTFNEGVVFYAGSPRLTGVVREIVEYLTPAVSGCLKHPFRIVNVRVLRTLSTAPTVGSNNWHSDGFPADVIKMMIYFTPVSADRGTTAIRLSDGSEVYPEGPAGLWLLFRNTELLHRGLPPKVGERIAMELTIAPSLKQNRRRYLQATTRAIPNFRCARVSRESFSDRSLCSGSFAAN